MKIRTQGDRSNILEGESDIVTNNKSRTLVDHTIEALGSRRYTPKHFKDKERGTNENLYSCYQGKSGGNMKNSLMVIHALYEKGLINAETLSNVEKRYGRLDG